MWSIPDLYINFALKKIKPARNGAPEGETIEPVHNKENCLQNSGV